MLCQLHLVPMRWLSVKFDVSDLEGIKTSKSVFSEDWA